MMCLPSAWIWDFSYFIPFIKTLKMTYHRLHMHLKCSLSPLDRIGSMTTYGNSKSIPDKACKLFHNGAIGWMNDFQHHDKMSLLAVTVFHKLLWHICTYMTGNSGSIWQITEPGCKGSGLSIDFIIPTCIQQHDIQYAYVIKVKIWHETLMNREIEGAAQKRNCFAEGNVELF